MPRVNTIIIDRADRFGLAQLYQIRGRVGRSSQRAFAYLMTPPGEQLGHDARRRLSALTEFQALGSGYHIAMRDLEIRGAGNILGSEQHGHLEAIGFVLMFHDGYLINASSRLRITFATAIIAASPFSASTPAEFRSCLAASGSLRYSESNV